MQARTKPKKIVVIETNKKKTNEQKNNKHINNFADKMNENGIAKRNETLREKEPRGEQRNNDKPKLKFLLTMKKSANKKVKIKVESGKKNQKFKQQRKKTH